MGPLAHHRTTTDEGTMTPTSGLLPTPARSAAPDRHAAGAADGLDERDRHDVPPVDVWLALDRSLDLGEIRPRLHAGAEVARFALRDGTAEVTLHDRRARTYLRLTEAEADLLALMDGTRTVDDLASVDATAGALGGDGVPGLVGLLHRRGFLDRPYVDVTAALDRALHPPPSGWRGRIGNAARTFQVQWDGADASMRWLYQHIARHLFHPVVKVATTALGLGGMVAFSAATAGGHFRLAPRSLGLAVLLLFVLDALSMSIHEAGHAMVLVRHGRRVNGAGVRMYFGSPAFYIESTDALMMGRRQRIWQSFAGPWFQIVSTGAAALAVLAFPGAWCTPLLWRFCALSYVMVLMNLVPLLELDGYWILSDALRIRDLRSRSLTFVRRDVWSTLRGRQRFTRADLAMAGYGVAGVAFTIAVAGTAAVYWWATATGLAGRLVDAGPPGLATLAVLVVLVTAPLASSAVTRARALRASVGRLGAKARFRIERRWRIEAAHLVDRQVLFDELPGPVLGRVAGVVELVSVPAGQAVIRRGERGDAWYLVRRGDFEVLDDEVGGRTGQVGGVVRRVGPGGSFGAPTLLDRAPHAATVRAVTAGQLFRVPRGAFEHLLADHVRADHVRADLPPRSRDDRQCHAGDRHTVPAGGH